MIQDRRKNARIRLAVEVGITSGSNFYAARTRDISTGGLFIETPVALPVGAPVEVELSLTGNRHALRAEVAWVLGAADGSTEGVGVRFLDVVPRTRAAIEHFMARRAPMPFEMLEGDAVASSASV